jgi:hypothetical protein
MTFDTSTEMGLTASACARWRGLCVGAVVRARRAATFDDADKATDLTRTGYDFLLAAELPLRLGRSRLSPGLTFGGGWMETTGIPGGAVGHITPERVATRGLRAGAQVTWSLPITRSVRLDAGVSLDSALSPHDEPFLFGRGDEGCTTIVTFPGEPRFWMHAGFGLQVEL